MFVELLRPFCRIAGYIASTDLRLYPVAAMLLSRRRDRGVRRAVRTADGFEMNLKVGDYPDGSMYLGIYEPSLLRLARRLLRPGDIAIDAGANIGYVSLHLSRAVGPSGRVHSFEPMPDNLQRLRHSIQANNASNVTIHANAVGASAGKVDIYDFRDDRGGGHALGSLRPLMAHHRTIPCEVVRLDDVVQGPVRLIKVDVEGAEVGALLGASQIIAAHRPHIIVESNPQALAAFGHSFADIFKAVVAAYPEYQSLDLEHLCPRPLSRRGILAGRLPMRQCNIWLRPV